jgi:hypothetical protein
MDGRVESWSGGRVGDREAQRGIGGRDVCVCVEFVYTRLAVGEICAWCKMVNVNGDGCMLEKERKKEKETENQAA